MDSNAAPARSGRSAELRRGAAAAAVIGGAAWTFKAGVTLATGDEPAVAYVFGAALFPFALLGLWSLVRGDGRAAQIGGALATAAAVAVVLGGLVRAIGGSGVEGGEDEVTVLTPFIAIAGFGTFAGLIALGLAVRRASALAGRCASLPLAIGLAAIPLLIVGGALETISARLLEVPIALLGLAWIVLGAALWSTARREAEAPTVMK